MTKIILRAILCALLLVMGSVSTAVAKNGPPDHQVPIQGYLVGLDEVPNLEPGDCNQVPEVDLMWRFASSGTGRLSHLGRVSYHFSHCTYWDATIRDGVLTISAANGDSLVLAYTAIADPFTLGGPTATWTMSWTVDSESGTGRFVDATGSGDGSAVTHVPPPMGSSETAYTELSLSGQISYDASNRSHK